jgi:hypothetical protein
MENNDLEFLIVRLTIRSTAITVVCGRDQKSRTRMSGIFRFLRVSRAVRYYVHTAVEKLSYRYVYLEYTCIRWQWSGVDIVVCDVGLFVRHSSTMFYVSLMDFCLPVTSIFLPAERRNAFHLPRHT